MKKETKTKAILLRREGLTYSEILDQIPVSKSTLSDWLNSVGLSNKQRQQLTQRKIIAMKKGAETVRTNRINKTKKIFEEAKSDFKQFTCDKETLFIMGLLLYWAEGSKEKEYRIGQAVVFSNSDPYMSKLMLNWFTEVINLPLDRLRFELYIHKSSQNRIIEVKKYWSTVTALPIELFDKIYYKKHAVNPKRLKTGAKYFGQLRIRITRSVDLNRRISGWIQALCVNCGVV